MKIEYSFRGKNSLRLNFNFPVGIESFGFTPAEFDYFMKKYNPNVKFSQEILENITKDINEILLNNFGDNIDLDWRDDNEIEVHNIEEIDKTKVEDVIQEIKTKIGGELNV